MAGRQWALSGRHIEIDRTLEKGNHFYGFSKPGNAKVNCFKERWP